MWAGYDAAILLLYCPFDGFEPHAGVDMVFPSVDVTYLLFCSHGLMTWQR